MSSYETAAFWQMTHTDNSYEKLLKGGWEPFAIDHVPAGWPRVWFRRPVVNAALAGFLSFREAVEE